MFVCLNKLTKKLKGIIEQKNKTLNRNTNFYWELIFTMVFVCQNCRYDHAMAGAEMDDTATTIGQLYKMFCRK